MDDEEEELLFQLNALLARRLGYKLTEKEYFTFKKMILQITDEELENAIEITQSKNLPSPVATHKYLCGIIWKIIKQEKDESTEVYRA